MKILNLIGLLIIVIFAGCKAKPQDDGKMTVRVLPHTFVSPESCERMDNGWAVSDQGCGFDQEKCDFTGKGSVIFVNDDGSSGTLVSGLTKPNGIAVDVDGNLWIAAKGEIAVRRQDGIVLHHPIPGSKLLNDIVAAPWAPRTIWVTDSLTGIVHLVTMDKDGFFGDAPYASMPDGPNGITSAWDSDGAVVVTLGDFTLGKEGKAGNVQQIDPATAGQDPTCASWHGGSPRPLGKFGKTKLDGIVPFMRNGVRGYLVSSIYDVGVGDADTKLGFLPEKGGEAVTIFDVKGHGLRSAADIGRDSKTGDICVPDLNGSEGLTVPGAAGAKVLIIHNLK